MRDGDVDTDDVPSPAIMIALLQRKRRHSDPGGGVLAELMWERITREVCPALLPSP